MARRYALDTDVRFIKGVGPVRAAAFARLGIATVADLIEHFPFRYALKPKSIPVGNLELDATATVVGALRGVRPRGPHSRQSISATLMDGTGQCRVRWFNSPHLIDKLHDGQIVRLTGKVRLQGDLASFTNPELAIISESGDPFEDDHDRQDAVYPATAGLPPQAIPRAINQVLDDVLDAVVDFIPIALRNRRGLPPRRTAVERMHRPTTLDDVSVARRRLAYDELLLCQLAVQMSRARRRETSNDAPVLAVTPTIDRRIRRRIPFSLTPGQDQAVGEIVRDLAQSRPMNRLLQADVGAGKTVVALYAALVAVARHKQVALLAPTEVLAAQHRAKIENYLSASRVRTAFLAGSTPRTERTRLLNALADGTIDLLIGTHALLEPDVRFHDLALAIIDEQHKFGVAQRAALRAKGRAPHVLVLTATPIPRTLAMTLFGDLDVSTIHGVPPGRQPVTTRVVTPDLNGDAWAFVRSRVRQREQAFIVYPLVEESDDLPLRAATAELQRLDRSVLSGCRLGLLHGRMRQADKQDVMDRFRSGAVQVLVCTTVIEVGVDVPAATMMIVQHAERYGLSQLHQLRGRVGRGDRKAFCLLFTESTGGDALTRLRVLCASSDGFFIAEQDLRLRGPGELLGKRQHGLPAFRVANLLTDLDLLEQARDDAARLLSSDTNLAQRRHAALRAALMARYGSYLDLIDVA